MNDLGNKYALAAIRERRAALRRAGKPMRMAEVIDALVAELGYGPEAAKGMNGLAGANLLHMAKLRGLVVKEGIGWGARWALSPA